MRSDETDLPALYKSADALAAAGQRRTKRYIAAELLLLIGAGATGIQPLRVGPARIDVLAVAGALLFLGALVVTVVRALRKPEDDWYAGRAAAESAKTLAWRYAVGGDPFPLAATDRSAEERFLGRLTDVLRELDTVSLEPTGTDDREITAGMRELRARTYAERTAAYRERRIEDQLSWYQRRGGDHSRSAGRWLAVAVGASVLGLLAATARAVGLVDADLLGLAASCATAAIGWSQTRQHRNLAAAYRLTARELSLVRERLPTVEEDDWALFVSDAEDAMSREHALWLARHGHPTGSR